MGLHSRCGPPQSSCQRKVEMSGFSQSRNVRFHGLLQGCSAGTWYLGLILLGGAFDRQGLQAVGRKDLPMAKRLGAGAQGEIAPAEPQPVRPIQSPFDFHLRSAKPRADFFPRTPQRFPSQLTV